MAEMNPLTLQRYEELRSQHREQLLRSVDPTEELLSALEVIDTFGRKMTSIRSLTTAESKADKILSLPSDENFNGTIGPFLTALARNGHEHVANVFVTGSNADLPTDDSHQLLCDKLEDLCSYLDPGCSIVSSLISNRVFTWSDAERVSVHETVNEKVYQIIKILSRKSNSSYQGFIRTLQGNDQEHILHILTGNAFPPLSKEDLNLIKKNANIYYRQHGIDEHTFDKYTS